MINVMENKILGPLLLQQFEQGERKGQQKGQQQGRQELLRELLTQKFGTLPAWAIERLQSAPAEDLRTCALRVLQSSTLEDALR
ncbi:MAG: DUF4351 domain-containing protein [Bryobacterales bacterium]|nr:DUF4351 domain-containing protein [Bryobacterales bacterium]